MGCISRKDSWKTPSRVTPSIRHHLPGHLRAGRWVTPTNRQKKTPDISVTQLQLNTHLRLINISPLWKTANLRAFHRGNPTRYDHHWEIKDWYTQWTAQQTEQGGIKSFTACVISKLPQSHHGLGLSYSTNKSSRGRQQPGGVAFISARCKRRCWIQGWKYRFSLHTKQKEHLEVPAHSWQNRNTRLVTSSGHPAPSKLTCATPCVLRKHSSFKVTVSWVWIHTEEPCQHSHWGLERRNKFCLFFFFPPPQSDGFLFLCAPTWLPPSYHTAEQSCSTLVYQTGAKLRSLLPTDLALPSP